MRKIRCYLETGYSGVNIEEDFEVEDDTSDREIDIIAKETIFNEVSFGWYEVIE